MNIVIQINGKKRDVILFLKLYLIEKNTQEDEINEKDTQEIKDKNDK